VRCSKPRCSGLRSLARHVYKRLSANALFLSIANLPPMSAAAACPSHSLSLSPSPYTHKRRRVVRGWLRSSGGAHRGARRGRRLGDRMPPLRHARQGGGTVLGRGRRACGAVSAQAQAPSPNTSPNTAITRDRACARPQHPRCMGARGAPTLSPGLPRSIPLTLRPRLCG